MSEEPARSLVPIGQKFKSARLECVEMTDEEFRKAMIDERKNKKAKVAQLELVKVSKGRAEDTTGGFQGPWAPFEEEHSLVAPGPSPKEIAQHTAELAAASKALKVHRVDHGKERCILHGDDDISYFKAPSEEECGRDLSQGSGLIYHPPAGKLLHTWIGHEKAVSSIDFFPQSGHLLLSASMDCRIKLWDVYRHGKERPCVRTLIGHNKPVKEALFSPDGSLIVSLSFDRHSKAWDTETGSCLTRLKHRRVPYCAAQHPSSPSSIVVGCADGSIMQWDLRSGKAELEYFEHQSPVNSIVFLDEQRFVSASDDLSLKTWDLSNSGSKRTLSLKEYDAINCVKLHPKGALACQSLSSQIIALEVEDDALGKRVSEAAKVYSGHNTSGYACKLEVSPDGRCLTSGDGKGFLFFWDWKSAQITKRFKAHDQACVDVAWNPQEANRMATCSWDGVIKYWS